MSDTAVYALATLAAAIVTALSTWAVARVGRRTSRESQGVQALAESVDGYRELLEDTRASHAAKLTDLQSQIDGLARDKDHLAGRVKHLETALAAARRYIDALLATLRLHDITPPDPPADYTDGH